jgi:hypothetical protein
MGAMTRGELAMRTWALQITPFCAPQRMAAEIPDAAHSRGSMRSTLAGASYRESPPLELSRGCRSGSGLAFRARRDGLRAYWASR